MKGGGERQSEWMCLVCHLLHYNCFEQYIPQLPRLLALLPVSGEAACPRPFPLRYNPSNPRTSSSSLIIPSPNRYPETITVFPSHYHHPLHAFVSSIPYSINIVCCYLLCLLCWWPTPCKCCCCEGGSDCWSRCAVYRLLLADHIQATRDVGGLGEWVSSNMK